jgi:diguanylate cyclase (GGDEF)-like protein
MKFNCHSQLGALASVDNDELLFTISQLVAGVRLATTVGEMETLQEMAQQGMSAAIRAEQEIATLRERIISLERLVTTDELTDVLNRRGFEAELRRTLDLARRHGETGVLLFVDLDNFKRVNDTYGHAAGDAVLRHVASLLKQSVRRSDVVARLGGDEFVVLLTKACILGGTRRKVALERTLRSAVVNWRDWTIKIGASVGARPYGPCDEYDALIREADECMYAQKSEHLLRGRRLRGARFYRAPKLPTKRPAVTAAS